MLARIFSHLIISCCFISGSGAQTFFSTLPDLQEKNTQAQAFLSIPKENGFFVLGDYVDSSQTDHSVVISPYLAKFDYYGSLSHFSTLSDTSYAFPFRAEHYSSVRKNPSVLYYYAYRDMGGFYLTSYLVEIDLLKSEIKRGRLIESPAEPNFPACAVTYNGVNELAVANNLWRGDTTTLFITRLDTFFNVLQTIEVEGNIERGRQNIPYHIEYGDNHNFILIGESRRSGIAGFDTADLFYMNVDTSGIILEANFAPSPLHLRFVYASSYTILKDSDANWIISAGELAGIDSCSYCRKYIPYIASITPGFDTLNWITRFLDVPIHPSIQNFVFSNTECSDGFVSSGFRICSESELCFQTGFLFKTNKQGDSLWMKHYIPLDWDSTRATWIKFNDIKTTPDDNLIVSGALYDRDLSLTRPWILHLDKDGCLIPGCDSLLDTYDHPEENNSFIIYPNPTTGYLYLQALRSLSEELEISIIDISGRQQHKLTLSDIREGYLYFLRLDGMVPGTYFLNIFNKRENVTEQHKFIYQ